MSNTITNIGRVSGPAPAAVNWNEVRCRICKREFDSERDLDDHMRDIHGGNRLVTVEANGLSLDLLPGEDPAAIFAQAEAVIDEKDARPGLGLEPDAGWAPGSEPDLMGADLVALRSGLVRPYAYMDAATAEAIEDERIGADICEQPYSW